MLVLGYVYTGQRSERLQPSLNAIDLHGSGNVHPSGIGGGERNGFCGITIEICDHAQQALINEDFASGAPTRDFVRIDVPGLTQLATESQRHLITRMQLH